MSYNQIKVQLCSHWGADRDAANAAWASSFDKAIAEARSDHDVMRIVTGLVNNQHDTPKERIWLEFFITAPLYVEAQYDKYRLTLQFQHFELSCDVAEFGRLGITQNQLSGRYRTMPDRAYRLPNDVADICGKALFCLDKQHPKEEWYTSPVQAGNEVKSKFDAFLQEQHNLYQDLLSNLRAAENAGAITNSEYKRAREVLRGMLGTAYMTDFRIVLNMNAFEHIINQRLARDAQLESRIVAYLMLKEALEANIAPTLVNAMIDKHGWRPLMDELTVRLLA